jgi:hypothetical protein
MTGGLPSTKDIVEQNASHVKLGPCAPTSNSELGVRTTSCLKLWLDRSRILDDKERMRHMKPRSQKLLPSASPSDEITQPSMAKISNLPRRGFLKGIAIATTTSFTVHQNNNTGRNQFPDEKA